MTFINQRAIYRDVRDMKTDVCRLPLTELLLPPICIETQGLAVTLIQWTMTVTLNYLKAKQLADLPDGLLS